MRKRKNSKTQSFTCYRVTANGRGSISIFAASPEAAEKIARRILGEAFQHSYEGPLEVQKEAGIGSPSEKDT